MAFIATPAFSNLYRGGLLTTATVPITNGVSTTVFPTNDPTFITASNMPFNPYEMGITSSAANGMFGMAVGMNETTRIVTAPSSEKKPILDPFDPAAVVPLPNQLEDQFGPFTTSVWKRNERERFRVRCVNDGYQRLRKHLPVAEDEKRLSKVDTLRLAIRYIRHLAEIVRNDQHLIHCRCFENFTEQSEGHVQILLAANGRRH
ncbi:unnamed protein product, partial [Mesorhabditis belari]|uniref:BHLH domain-containing protein n=1 Tax=Mesorhabditis belari TaxID=2138241 RepID=A0AAF3EZS9_9BILA